MATTTSEFALFIGLAQAVESSKADQYLQRLDNSGISRHWFSSKSLSSIMETALRKWRQGSTISFIDLFVTSNLDTKDQVFWASKWSKCKEMEQVNGDLNRIVGRVKRDAALREVQEMVQTTRSYMKDNPDGVLTWLPSVVQTMRSILSNGQKYDPRPSSIWRDSFVPRVTYPFVSGFTALNEMFGGGLWNGQFFVYGTPSNQGKSTFVYTVIAHTMASGLKTTLFSREASAAECMARIMQAYGGFTREEVELKQGNTPERQDQMIQALSTLDQYLTIYDQHSAGLGDIGEIVHWEQPTLAIIDHLGLFGDEKTTRLSVMGKRDTMGDLAEFLRDLSRSESCTVLATSQFAAGAQKTLITEHDLNPTVYYGTSRIYNAADIALIAMRDWNTPGKEWIKCKKDRAEGILRERIWRVQYDAATRSYCPEVIQEPEPHWQ